MSNVKSVEVVRHLATAVNLAAFPSKPTYAVCQKVVVCTSIVFIVVGLCSMFCHPVVDCTVHTVPIKKAVHISKNTNSKCSNSAYTHMLKYVDY